MPGLAHLPVPTTAPHSCDIFTPLHNTEEKELDKGKKNRGAKAKERMIKKDKGRTIRGKEPGAFRSISRNRRSSEVTRLSYHHPARIYRAWHTSPKLHAQEPKKKKFKSLRERRDLFHLPGQTPKLSLYKTPSINI
ncbi:hypothetical protein TWF481_000801 [Arthrobotrys musiformis]|uniref:Uncharacterized protein n=1 Tax=Arthrobotrys musiformis TaxID=47236 RepID=A0AAV9WNN5_9PEZI